MPISTSRRRMLTGVAALGAGVGLAGCGDPVVGLDPRARSLDIDNGAEPLSLDPHKCASAAEANIVGNMFVGLTTENERAEPVPGMAERWEVSADGLTWTFYLRPAVWSDGVRCDAHDFEFSFRRALMPDTFAERASVLFPLKNAEAVNKGAAPPELLGATAQGDLVFEITLERPTPYLPQLLKHPMALPAPKHVIERLGEAWIKPPNAVSNGAFTLLKWWSDTVIHLRKNPRFWEAGSVALADLYFYPNRDAAAAGDVGDGARGWAAGFPAEQVDALRRAMPAYVRVAPRLETRGFAFNCTRAPFSDVRVRQALTMALARERFAGPGERAAYALVPPGVAGHAGTARYAFADQPLDARRTAALALLQQAGFGASRPLHFELAHETDSSAAALAAADWRALAPWVAPTLAPLPRDVCAARLRTRRYGVAEARFGASCNDAVVFLNPMLRQDNPENWSGYANPQFDTLVAQADLAPDVYSRDALLTAAEQLMLDEAPLCTTIFAASRNLVHPNLAGFADNLDDVHRARWFSIKNPTT